jgi:hypothetical protein
MHIGTQSQAKNTDGRRKSRQVAIKQFQIIRTGIDGCYARAIGAPAPRRYNHQISAFFF